MTNTLEPRGVHLVGSMALRDNEEVMRTATTILGARVRRLPDGETGERNLWIAWQMPKLAANPAIESRGARPSQFAIRAFSKSHIARRAINYAFARLNSVIPRGWSLRVRPGVAVDDIELGPLGYAGAAIDSYQVFHRLTTEGLIPDSVRFQVSIPSPLAIATFFPLEQRAMVVPVLKRQLLNEVAEMASAIPQEKLAIQWDTPMEVTILEGTLPSPYGTNAADTRQQVFDLLVQLGEAVPTRVSLGYHLCYGDFGGQHFKEPTDTSRVVDIANGLARQLSRPLTWIHFPVPRDRADEAYFSPLRDLAVADDTEVYAGLIHPDGLDANRARAEAVAREIGREFGVGTECGMGRISDPRKIPAILRMHAEIAVAVVPR
jgi:hypothetical protein